MRSVHIDTPFYSVSFIFLNEIGWRLNKWIKKENTQNDIVILLKHSIWAYKQPLQGYTCCTATDEEDMR
ncbi:hypothetical protein BK141_15285 [Paenibacillus sp. FSL R5-0765]|nr:hypothetical protein BK141_15285 [Paenibacillus sp. FSL R5-0765]